MAHTLLLIHLKSHRVNQHSKELMMMDSRSHLFSEESTMMMAAGADHLVDPVVTVQEETIETLGAAAEVEIEVATEDGTAEVIDAEVEAVDAVEDVAVATLVDEETEEIDEIEMVAATEAETEEIVALLSAEMIDSHPGIAQMIETGKTLTFCVYLKFLTVENHHHGVEKEAHQPREAHGEEAIQVAETEMTVVNHHGLQETLLAVASHHGPAVMLDEKDQAAGELQERQELMKVLGLEAALQEVVKLLVAI